MKAIRKGRLFADGEYTDEREWVPAEMYKQLSLKCAALAKLVYPTHQDPIGKTREPPHCPSCSCGLPAVPEQTELDPEAKRALYENAARLYRR